MIPCVVPGVVPGVVLVRFDGPGDSSIISKSGDFEGRFETSARESFEALSNLIFLNGYLIARACGAIYQSARGNSIVRVSNLIQFLKFQVFIFFRLQTRYRFFLVLCEECFRLGVFFVDTLSAIFKNKKSFFMVYQIALFSRR